MAQWHSTEREAGARLFGTGTLVPVIAYVDEGKFFEPDVGSVELFLFRLCLLLCLVLLGEG